MLVAKTYLDVLADVLEISTILPTRGKKRKEKRKSSMLDYGAHANKAPVMTHSEAMFATQARLLVKKFSFPYH